MRIEKEDRKKLKGNKTDRKRDKKTIKMRRKEAKKRIQNEI